VRRWKLELVQARTIAGFLVDVFDRAGRSSHSGSVEGSPNPSSRRMYSGVGVESIEAPDDALNLLLAQRHHRFPSPNVR
jgi:hypothetical protein